MHIRSKDSSSVYLPPCHDFLYPHLLSMYISQPMLLTPVLVYIYLTLTPPPSTPPVSSYSSVPSSMMDCQTQPVPQLGRHATYTILLFCIILFRNDALTGN